MSKTNVLNVMEQTETKHQRFFQAWMRGVELLDPRLFGPKTPQDARRKEDLQPLPDQIEAAFAEESGGDEQFLAAMVSFFDPVWGEELATRIECYKSVCGLTYNLDHQQVEIIAELLRNYEGW